MAAHYAARAGAGLLITEATVISEEARGFPNTPGCYSEAQVAGWKTVLEAVRARGTGAKVFCQLWHQGRTANPQLSGVPAVGPSAVKGWATGFGGIGEACEALTLEGIARVLGDYRKAAECALAAGFDGVEVHGANGYLPDQFLHTSSNLRDDAYGGDVPRRARFLLDAVRAAVAVFGAGRVGVRVSPASHWQDVTDAEPRALFDHVARELDAIGVAYLHVVEPRETGLAATPTDPVDAALTGASLRAAGFRGPILSAGGHDYDSGAAFLANGDADAVVYGRHFIANPDLPARFAKIAAGEKVAMNTPNRDTFYSSGEAGCEARRARGTLEEGRGVARTGTHCGGRARRGARGGHAAEGGRGAGAHCSRGEPEAARRN